MAESVTTKNFNKSKHCRVYSGLINRFSHLESQDKCYRKKLDITVNNKNVFIQWIK